MDFKNVPKIYRPIPFWSWNEKLDIEETKDQICQMNTVGMGGFFMHARSGLQTEYMGEEWFDNVTTSVEKAHEYSMRPWAYDENGWPSGFASGFVNGLGVEYQQKYLRMEATKVHLETSICENGGYHFYYDVNPYYVDTLDKKVVAKFIEYAYQPYYEKYANKIEGFFTDEPQISRAGIPWSFCFDAEYQSRYNENISECLEQLFLPIGDYKNTRIKFWKMVTELFSESYMKQIYKWCEERELKLTGHLLLEETLESQLITNGACMPHYEYMHIPGVDWLGREIKKCLTMHQVSSVAEQFGKEAVIAETYALCGHNVSFAELKGLYEWKLVHGINLLCQHLEGYSIRGMRKRDYPPAMYIQQPWWNEYGSFIDAISREGMILAQGKHEVNVLVIHPQTTAWSLFDANKNSGLKELNDNFLKSIEQLEEKHIEFHLGDEIILERHGKVMGDKLVIGNQKYSYVINSNCEILMEKTKRLLSEFQKAGGKIVQVDDLQDNKIIDNPRITYTKREFDDCYVHYFVNTSAKTETATLNMNGKRVDIFSGKLSCFAGKHCFEPWGSLILVEDKNKCCGHESIVEQNDNNIIIKPKDKMKIVSITNNVLVLDKCDYYFDDILQEKNGYILNIVERANELGKSVSLHQDFYVEVDYVPKELYLVCETPEKFNIFVNGKKLKQHLKGWFIDKSFKKLDISGLLKKGKNVISFFTELKQTESFYNNFAKAKAFESEKNKLVYDMEVEPIYLLGDFSVKTDGEWTNLDKNSVRYKGNFVIDEPKFEISIQHMEKQGFPFFCGEMVLESDINISSENSCLEFTRRGFNTIKVEINGTEKLMLTEDSLNLGEFNAKGKTNVRFTLINNLRNLLGPHHLEKGESYWVGPGSFYKEPCIWNNYRSIDAGVWNEDYCFVEMGI